MVETPRSDSNNSSKITIKKRPTLLQVPTPSTPLLQHGSDTPHPCNCVDATTAAADKEVEMLMMNSMKQHENVEDAMLFLPVPTSSSTN